MTATDDALMAAVRAYGLAHCASVKERPDPGLESTVRAAAIAYGDAREAMGAAKEREATATEDSWHTLATDDALAALMDAVKRDAICDSDPGHHVGLYFWGADIRAAALAYGRAVAIEACRGFIDSENVEAMHGTYIHVRMKQYIERELRAADSTGGT